MSVVHSVIDMSVLHDEENGDTFTPLHHVPNQKPHLKFTIVHYLKQIVVGFEYGYNVENKNSMNIWEAQYGDFSNMAQMMFDNFMSKTC